LPLCSCSEHPAAAAATIITAATINGTTEADQRRVTRAMTL
jgi:hypothetical protein